MEENSLTGAIASNNTKGNDQPLNGQGIKSASGTKEWADYNINVCSGCANMCRYCYAQSMAIRFKRKTPDTWKEEVVNQKAVDKNYRKLNGVCMYPSSHDITPGTLDASLTVLKKILEEGNDVLIVTKPRYDIIDMLCDELKAHKEHILFRFTIGSSDSATLKFWEPGAPSFEERILALEYAYQKGFNTSISMEPVLDLIPEKVVEKVYEMVTNDIWIGLPNKLNQRLKVNGYGDDEQVMRASAELQSGQSNEWVLKLVEKYADDQKIRWKDSVRKVIINHKKK